MKYRKINVEDLYKYGNDIIKCYESNNLVFDSQNPLTPSVEFLQGFVEAPDSIVVGILSDDDKFLYGLVIFDNIRFGIGGSCAEVHIVNDRAIWGHKIRDIYREMIDNCEFSVLYCQIPSIAVAALALCKRLGFKKTGYIPRALPYINNKGEERLYDIQIMSLER